MSKTTRVVLLTDLHLRSDYIPGYLDSQMETLTKLVNYKKTDAVVLNGDIFHKRNPDSRRKEVNRLRRDIFGLIRHQKATTDKRYRQGAALHDAINTVTSQHPELVVRLRNGQVSIGGGDSVMDDVMAAVLSGNIVPQTHGGFTFTDESGQALISTAYISDNRGFIRLRGTVQGRYFNGMSTNL